MENELTVSDRLDMLQEAARKLDGVIYLISEAVKGTPYENTADAYILPHLRDWLSVHSCSIDSLMEYLEELE